MMKNESKCVTWKRIGAKKVIAQISGLNQEQELEFWQKETDKLKESQKKSKQSSKKCTGFQCY